MLGLPTNRVTVEVRRMGGGFGGKESQATLGAGSPRWPPQRPAGR